MVLTELYLHNFHIIHQHFLNIKNKTNLSGHVLFGI